MRLVQRNKGSLMYMLPMSFFSAVLLILFKYGFHQTLVITNLKMLCIILNTLMKSSWRT